MSKKSNFELEALELISELQEEIKHLQVQRLQKDYWLLFAKQMMEHLPKETVRNCFNETHKDLLHVFQKSKEQYPNLGPYAQDAMIDWSQLVNKMIDSVDEEESEF